jgi:hypothetical protein
MAIGAVVARIVSQYSDKGSKAAARDIGKLGKNFDAFAKKAAKSFAIAGAASAAFAIKLGVDSVKAAITAQGEQDRLRQILETTNGATTEQIKALNDQADALERLGVVSGGNISVVQSQLATFDLQATTIKSLTPAILDYVTAEKGATAASDQFKSMTNGLAQALNGQFGALTRAGFVLDEQTKKLISNGTEAERANAIVKVLNSTYKGFNEALRDTPEGQLQATRNAIEAIKTELGTALLPVVTEFTTYLQTNLLPQLQAWTNANKDKIAASLKDVFEVLKTVIVKMGEFFGFISRNIGTLQVFGAILAGIFVGAKIYAGITALVAAIGLVTTALTAQTAAASAAAIATGFATAGASLTLGAAAAVIFYTQMNKVQKSVQGATTAINEQTTAIGNYSMSANRVYESTEKVVVKLTKAEIAAAAAAKKAGAAAALDAKKKLASLKAIAALTKLGAKPTAENDPIQLEAARLNLVKQGIIAEQEKLAQFVNARKIEAESLKASAEAAMRYNDILAALGDAKITPAEFELLAAKWGISTNAAQLYIQTIISVRDNQVSADEVAKLAETWGVTYQQASKYLDFFTAINDGYLSESEIVKLQEKWGFTRKEVTQYSDAFAAADDGKIDLTEIVALGDKWGLTKKETEKYLALILQEFGYDPSLLAAPVESETAWTAAYGSVETYKEIAEGVFTVPSTINDASDAAAVGWFSAAAAAASYAAAVGAANSAVITPPIIPPSVIQPVIPPVIPPTMLGPSSMYNPSPYAAVGGPGYGIQSPTSMFGDGGVEAITPFAPMGSVGSNITINVGGNVISEGDLVGTIRDQLLGLQQSGKSITLSAIAI